MPAFSLRAERRDLIAAGALVLLALAVRLWAWHYQVIVSVDGTTYIRLARYLFGGPFIDTQQPPGFPFLIGLANLLWRGDGVNAAKSVDLVCGVLVMIPFYVLAKDLVGRFPAILTGALFALTPLAIRYSVTTMSESPYVLLLVTAACLAYRKRDFAAGGLTGLAFLVRPEGLVMAPALGLARGMKPRAWALIAAGALVFGAVPALVFNHHTTGAWTLTRKGVNIIEGDFLSNEVTPERTTAPPKSIPILERVSRFRGSIAHVWPGRLWAECVNLRKALGWGFLLAAAAGFVTGPHFAIAGLAQAFVVPLFPGVPPAERFVLPLFPFMLILAAGAIRKLGGADRPWRSWKARAGLALALGAWAFQAVPLVPSLTLNEDGFFPELKRAGDVLGPAVSGDMLIFGRKPYTAFYAGTRFQTTPLGDYHKTIDAVVAAGGDYLVVDQAVCEIFRPALLPLATDSAVMWGDPRLEIVYFDPSLLGRHTAVYRILRPGGQRRMGDGEELARQLRSRIPHDAKNHRLHAELAWMSRDPDRTVHEFELAIAENPDDLWCTKTLAGLLLDLKRRPERALELAEKALALEPGDAGIEALVERARSAAAAR